MHQMSESSHDDIRHYDEQNDDNSSATYSCTISVLLFPRKLHLLIEMPFYCMIHRLVSFLKMFMVPSGDICLIDRY